MVPDGTDLGGRTLGLVSDDEACDNDNETTIHSICERRCIEVVAAISARDHPSDDDNEEVPYENGWPHDIHFELRARLMNEQGEVQKRGDDSYLDIHGLINLLGKEDGLSLSDSR